MEQDTLIKFLTLRGMNEVLSASGFAATALSCRYMGKTDDKHRFACLIHDDTGYWPNMNAVIQVWIQKFDGKANSSVTCEFEQEFNPNVQEAHNDFVAHVRTRS
jgi:hypothetical protein